MQNITRREFGGLALAMAAAAPALRASGISIDDTLRSGIQKRKIPCVSAAVGTSDKVTYQGAFGKRDSGSGIDCKPDSIFFMASMTKAVTSVAAMQLVEQGKVKLDEPLSKYMPELAKLQVIDGFDSAGKARLRPVRTPVTLKHMLTHTSGLAYDTWSEEMQKYEKGGGAAPTGVAPLAPLVFEPGTRWQYGYGADWAGKLVETISGMNLEQYFVKNILDPLGMKDTLFSVPESKFDRLVSEYTRQPDGSLKENPRTRPLPPKAYNGGGGLYSTAGDYLKFTQMILRKGAGPDAKSPRVLKPETVAQMSVNQIGNSTAGKLKTFKPQISADVDVQPGATEKWGLGFLINTTPYQGGRSAGSLAWAGIANTFYWIDPKRNLAGVILMQFLPFVDKEAVGLLGDFEHSVYANVG